jgi:hypothetical protein
VLSYRENAELSKHCSLLLGGSSGITWLMTSEWATKLPTIQFLHRTSAWYSFASVKYDHQFFGLDTGHIFETDLSGEQDIADLVAKYLNQKTFDGLAEQVFRPSIGQVYRLYEMMEGRVDLGRLLANFVGRNAGVTVNTVEFYSSIASIALRLRTRRIAKAILRRLKRAHEVLSSS